MPADAESAGAALGPAIPGAPVAPEAAVPTATATTATATTATATTATTAAGASGASGAGAGTPAPDPVLARRRKGWFLYGWGAHAFQTTVLGVFLGPYITDLAQNAAGGEKHHIHVFGVSILAESFFPFAVTAAALLEAAILPLIGALADRTGRTRQLLTLAMGIGVVATLLFYTVTGQAYLYGGVLFLIANLCYGVANVLANGYLPVLAAPDERNAVSSRGWAIGYLGGALLLLVNLGVYTAHSSLGMSQSHAARVALASAGLWWVVFGFIGLRRLTGRDASAGADASGQIRSAARPETDLGYRQIARTLRALSANRNALLFLLAYVAYNEGVQTVISFASTYGTKELDLDQSVMASAILLVQFVAFGGALWLGRLAGRHGSKRVVSGSLVAWIGVLVAAFFVAKDTAWQFYLVGCMIGVVLGGTQALSRSLFAQIIPSGQEGEYYGLYEISQNGTAWIGSLTVALAIDLTSSYRLAIVSLVAFFVIGLVLLSFTDLRAAVREAGNPVPELL